ncbi:MAG: hypothetical protein Q4G64_08460, partial [bacterium]|nr:hypothetical protein [bacterium]
MEGMGEVFTALGEAWSCALPPFGQVEGDPGTAVGTMSDPGLLAVLGALGDVTKRVDALTAMVAGEISRRSPREAGQDGLARKAGYSSPGKLVAGKQGSSAGRGATLVKVGDATSPRRTL